MKETGLIHVYYGNGKGKTTCGMGLCFRAAGAGCKVLIYQFMKDGRGHERRILENLPNVLCANAVRDVSFSFQMSDDEKNKERDRYRSELKLVFDRVRQESWDVLFLDEVLYAISCHLLQESVLTEFLDAKPEGLEVILTGNDLSEEIRKRADYVSRIVKEKHPYDRGLHARSGIEY